MGTLIAWDEKTDKAFSPERFPEEGEYCFNGRQKKHYYAPPPESTLADVKLEAIDKVKFEAGERISALDWMVQRAERHEKLAKTGKKTESEALQLQQDIEEASDVAEDAIKTLETIEEVRAFTW